MPEIVVSPEVVGEFDSDSHECGCAGTGTDRADVVEELAALTDFPRQEEHGPGSASQGDFNGAPAQLVSDDVGMGDGSHE